MSPEHKGGAIQILAAVLILTGIVVVSLIVQCKSGAIGLGVLFGSHPRSLAQYFNPGLPLLDGLCR